jgi:hypothetical protein
MKRSTLIKLLTFVGIVCAPAARAQVWNFHDAANLQGNVNGGFYHALYVGQGAYSDPGNNIWNGFGQYGAPGPSTEWFYGPSRPYTTYGNGNPGNPYAAYYDSGSWQSANGYPIVFGSGGTIDGSGNPTTVVAGNVTSHGVGSSVTLSISYSQDNGAGTINAPLTQGTPGFILGEAAIAPPNVTGMFTLHNVPAGNYDLYLYGANYDGDRGARFIVGNQVVTIYNNPALDGQHPGTQFDLGANYTILHGITPDGNGNITGTWDGQFTNPFTGQSGEGDFNGLQLVTIVPEPTTFGLFGLGFLSLAIIRRRK